MRQETAYDLAPDLAKLRVPTLVHFGADDEPSPAEMVATVTGWLGSLPGRP